jgi:hypothetical protein
MSAYGGKPVVAHGGASPLRPDDRPDSAPPDPSPRGASPPTLAGRAVVSVDEAFRPPSDRPPRRPSRAPSSLPFGPDCPCSVGGAMAALAGRSGPVPSGARRPFCMGDLVRPVADGMALLPGRWPRPVRGGWPFCLAGLTLFPSLPRCHSRPLPRSAERPAAAGIGQRPTPAVSPDQDPGGEDPAERAE